MSCTRTCRKRQNNSQNSSLSDVPRSVGLKGASRSYAYRITRNVHFTPTGVASITVSIVESAFLDIETGVATWALIHAPASFALATLGDGGIANP